MNTFHEQKSQKSRHQDSGWRASRMRRHIQRRGVWMVWSFMLFLTMASACVPTASMPTQERRATDGGVGGGSMNVDLPTVQLPFPVGTAWRCTQGAHGEYSHTGASTQYDVDLDTPNPPTEPADVFAPVSGFIWQFTSSTGFGTHVNIQIADNLFVVMGHLVEDSVPWENGLYVEAGAYIGQAGCTGFCNGAHVHLGVHAGQASSPANGTPSVPFAVFAADTQSWEGARAYSTEEMACGLSTGHFYESQLSVNPPWEDTPENDSYDSDPEDAYEGDQSGECSDGADNDRDQTFDCLDNGCFGAPNCAPESGDDDSSPSDTGDDDTTPTADDDDSSPADVGDDDTTPTTDDDDSTANNGDDTAGDDDTAPADDDSSPEPTPAGPTAHELCWTPTGLVNPRAGELWNWGGWSWQTVASATGNFTQLCGTVYTAPSATLTLNGTFTADNAPAAPWWICSNTGAGGMAVYGAFWVDGLLRPTTWVNNGVGGCDARVTVP